MFGYLIPKEVKFFDLFSEHADHIVSGAKELLALMKDFSKLEFHAHNIKTFEGKAEGEANGHSLGEPDNTADAPFCRNPKGTDQSGASRCCSFLVWNNQTSSLTPCAASRLIMFAFVS